MDAIVSWLYNLFFIDRRVQRISTACLGNKVAIDMFLWYFQQFQVVWTKWSCVQAIKKKVTKVSRNDR